MLCIGIVVLWGCQKEHELFLHEESEFIGSRAPGDYVFSQFYIPYSGSIFPWENNRALTTEEMHHLAHSFNIYLPASSPVWYKIWDEFRLRQVKVMIGIDKTLDKNSGAYYRQGTIFFNEDYIKRELFYFQHELLHVVQQFVLGYDMDSEVGMRNHEYEVAIVLDILNVFSRKSTLDDPREYFGRPAGEAGENYDKFMKEIVKSSIEGRLMVNSDTFQFHAWINEWGGYRDCDYQASLMPRLVMCMINMLFE